MKVAVCDDERIWAEELDRLLKEYGNVRHLDIFISYYNNGVYGFPNGGIKRN